MFLRYTNSKRTKLRHFSNNIIRDKVIGQMPFMSIRHDPLFCKAAVLFAHGIEQVIIKLLRDALAF